MTQPLPAEIETYFAASNAAKPEDLAHLFTPEGEVRDEREVHRGRNAIAAWARSAQERYRIQSSPLSVAAIGGKHVVTARVTGDFPGSPLELTYRFELSADGIRALDIS